MKTLIALIMLSLPVTSFAQVVYQQVEPVKGEFRSLREAWDKTSEFCYTLPDSSKQCLPVHQRGEIKVREKDAWGQSEEDLVYINKLSEPSKAVAQTYFRIYIRYMAFGQGRFAAHVFFIKEAGWGSNAKTIFAFGDLINGVPQINSMSFSSGLEYAGALIWAAREVAVKDTVDPKILQAQIVTANTPLLNLAEEVVNTYVNRHSLQGSPALLKP